MNGRKAQGWGFDLVVGLVIFLIGILSLFLYTINFTGSGEGELIELQSEAKSVADSLMSEGSPTDWNQTKVVRVGLISDGRINQTKVNNFRILNATSYSQTKSLFRITNEYFAFFDGNVSGGTGNYPTNPNNLARVTRAVVYGGNITTLNVYVWN